MWSRAPVTHISTFSEDDLRLRHGRLVLGEGLWQGCPSRPPLPRRLPLPLSRFDLGSGVQGRRLLALRHQVEDDGGDNLLAGPEHLRLEEGRGNRLDFGHLIHQGPIDVLLVFRPGTLVSV